MPASSPIAMPIRVSQLAPLVLTLSLLLTACVSMHGEASVLAPTQADGNSDTVAANQRVFYTSEDISLVQFNPLDGRKPTGRDQLKRIRIAAGTPGLVLGRGEGWLAVRFNTDDYLYFTLVENKLDGSRLGDPRIAGRYYLYLPDWDGRAGTVMLGGKPWLAVDNSRLAYLLTDRNARSGESLRDTSLCSVWMDERR